MGAGSRSEFSQRLLSWFNQNGRKDLPWQNPRTPYRVWVSEIMLQQTQVSTVIPYFERWLLRFPDLPSLADAPLDEVLEHWAGLGYYARARNLHQAARYCAAHHGGELPTSATDLCALPGIGLSTANAIVSQSTDRPAAVLDGNVRRVLARQIALDDWPGSSRAQRLLWAEAENRLPESRGADYTQAIMDLGALVCTRSKPQCSECPVQRGCQSFARGIQHAVPVSRPATRVRKQQLFWLAVVNGENQILLEKRPPAGIWGGMWSFPEASSLDGLAEYCGLDLGDSEPLKPRQHRLSHIAMSIHPFLMSNIESVRIKSMVKSTAEQQWFDLHEPALPAIPRPVADLVHQLREMVRSADNQDGDLE